MSLKNLRNPMRGHNPDEEPCFHYFRPGPYVGIGSSVNAGANSKHNATAYLYGFYQKGKLHLSFRGDDARFQPEPQTPQKKQRQPEAEPGKI